ncbi:MAG: DUF2752 domain-containing protein [Planctomycetes bacterium]|nr:DUF2752 domain-containing protein [Planctomycetota bacterium]
MTIRTLYTLAIQLLLIGLALTPLVIAWRLAPDARGFGTHEQLGMEPCGWLESSGQPCPTCGMTTAFANTVRLRLVAAFMANPAGLFLCLLCIALPIYVIRSWWLGLPPGRFFYGRLGRSWLAVLLFVLVFGWLFKILTYRP